MVRTCLNRRRQIWPHSGRLWRSTRLGGNVRADSRPSGANGRFWPICDIVAEVISIKRLFEEPESALSVGRELLRSPQGLQRHRDRSFGRRVLASSNDRIQVDASSRRSECRRQQSLQSRTSTCHRTTARGKGQFFLNSLPAGARPTQVIGCRVHMRPNRTTSWLATCTNRVIIF